MIAQLILNGFVHGAIIALMATGLNLIFGILRVVNFWHGEAFMFGAVIVYFLNVAAGVNYWLALPISVACIVLLGWGLDKAIFSRLRGDILGGAMVALGLSLVFLNMMWPILGPLPKSIPSVVTGTVEIGGAVVSAERLLVVCVSFAVVGGLFWLIKYTNLGKSMRAVQQDREVALVQGINVERVCGMTYGMATGLAALAGGLVGPLFAVAPPMGMSMMLLSLVVVVLGGMGTIIGALIASLIIGFQQSFTVAYIGAEWGLAISAIIAMAVLAIRPRGLAGRE